MLRKLWNGRVSQYLMTCSSRYLLTPTSSTTLHLRIPIRCYISRNVPVYTTQAVDEAMKLLSDKKLLRKRDIDDHFLTYNESMNLAQLVNFFYFCTKKSITLESEQLKKLASELASRRGSFDGAQLGKVLYSMKIYSGKTNPERELILAINSKTEGTFPIPSSQTISNMLYGLNQMNSHRLEVQTLLASLSHHIARSQCTLSGQEVASALYGLQGMDSAHEPVRDILRVLSRKIEFSPAEFSSQVISNSLYGLQGMKADNKEVLFLLRVLKYKIDQSRECLSPMAVSNSLYGLKSMNSDTLEVRRLLLSLCRVIQLDRVEHPDENVDGMLWNDEPLTPQGVACSLYGLQGMSSEYREVLKLLTALAQRMDRTIDLMSSQHIGMALHGFKNMSSKEPEVRLIVKHVAKIIGKSKKPIDTHGIALGLYGISQLSSEHEETRQLLQALTSRIFASQEPFLAITVANTLKGFHSLNIYDSSIVLDFMKSIFLHVKKCDEVFKPVTICKVIESLSFCGAKIRSNSSLLEEEGEGEEKEEEKDRRQEYFNKCERFISDFLKDITQKLQTTMSASPPPIFPIESLEQAFLGLVEVTQPEGMAMKQLLFSNLKRCTETKESFPISSALVLLRAAHQMGVETPEMKQGVKKLIQQISWWANHLREDESDSDTDSDSESDSESDSYEDEEKLNNKEKGKRKRSEEGTMKDFLQNRHKYEVVTLSNNSSQRIQMNPTAGSFGDQEGMEVSEQEMITHPSLSSLQYGLVRSVMELLIKDLDSSVSVSSSSSPEPLLWEYRKQLIENLGVILTSLQQNRQEQIQANEMRINEMKRRFPNKPTRRQKQTVDSNTATVTPVTTKKEAEESQEKEEIRRQFESLLTREDLEDEVKGRVQKVLEQL